MLSERGRGRLVGGLTFLQLVGLIVPFVLLLPIVTPPGAYLASPRPRPRGSWPACCSSS